MTLLDFKNGQELPAPNYVEDQYIILINGRCVGWSGSEEDLLNDHIVYDGTYYNKCVIEARDHDLYLRNNERL